MKLFFILSILGIIQNNLPGKSPVEGAWIHHEKNITTVLLFCDGYFTSARYTDTSFIETSGGQYSLQKDHLLVKEEFNTGTTILSDHHVQFTLNGDVLSFPERNLSFKRIDANNGELSGVWKITKRMQEGKLVPIHQTGTRKTLKVLTGKRFQWFAIDPASNSFSGTGGGTYTFKDGKYIESIEFFSRDASRIGASLSFDDHLENGEWHHTGLSSKGAKIYEVWGKVQ